MALYGLALPCGLPLASGTFKLQPCCLCLCYALPAHRPCFWRWMLYSLLCSPCGPTFTCPTPADCQVAHNPSPAQLSNLWPVSLHAPPPIQSVNPCGRLRALWNVQQVEALSNHPLLQHVMAVGTVFAAKLKGRLGSGQEGKPASVGSSSNVASSSVSRYTSANSVDVVSAKKMGCACYLARHSVPLHSPHCLIGHHLCIIPSAF